MAGSRTYRTKAIVLDKTKLKETANLILTLVDQTGRQIRAVAKGARKPGSRLAARCELCCEVDLLLRMGAASTSSRRPAAHRGAFGIAAHVRTPCHRERGGGGRGAVHL